MRYAMIRICTIVICINVLFSLKEKTRSVLNHMCGMVSGDTFKSDINRECQTDTYVRDTDIISSAAMLNINIYVYQKQGNRRSLCKYSPDQLLGFDDHVQPVDGIYLVNSNSDHFDAVNSVHSDTLTQAFFTHCCLSQQ